MKNTYHLRAFLILIALTSFSLAADISGCTAINSSGEYNLTSSISGSPNPVSGMSGLTSACIILSSDDIFLDCGGYSVANDGTTSSAGIAVNGSSSIKYDNVTVLNCNISGYTRGVHAKYATNLTLNNLSTLNALPSAGTSGDGMLLNHVTGGTLSNSTISNVTHEGLGVDYCFSVLISNNSISGVMDNAVELYRSENNIFSYNTVNDSPNGAISLVYSHNNTVRYNEFYYSLSGAIGITGENNSIYNNTMVGSRDYDIYVGARALTASYCNNLVENNTGSGGKPINYTNETVTWSNFEAASIILCNADNSVLTNVTVNGSSSYHANSLEIAHCENVTITDSRSVGNRYGFRLRFSENNTIVNNTAQENVDADLFFYDQNEWWYTILSNGDWACNNRIENLTGSGGRYVNYTNETVTWSNFEASEIVLCNADNSAVTNVTARGSDSLPNNGVYILYSANVTVGSSNSSGNHMGFSTIYSDNCTFTDNVACSNAVYSGINTGGDYFVYWEADGFYPIQSNNTIFANNTACNNQGSGFSHYYSYDTTFANNTAYGNGFRGFAIYGRSDLINNTAYENNYSGFYVSPDDTPLLYNTAYSNKLSGFFLYSASDAELTGNTAYNNGYGFTDSLYYFYPSESYTGWMYSYGVGPLYSGFIIDRSDNVNSTNNTAYGNNNYGFAINKSGNFNSTGDYAYGNGFADIYLGTNDTTRITNITNLILDNPSGGYSSYTNISINDTLDANTVYTIGWAPAQSGYPGSYVAFENKLISISPLTGSPTIDSLTWSWEDSEVGTYEENSFGLWEYSASAWTELDATVNTTTNKINYSSLTPSSIYGILGFRPQDSGSSSPSHECESDSDCAACETCTGGECTAYGECIIDADCTAEMGEGYTCDSCYCTATAPECTSDTDCGDGEICSQYSCVASPEAGCTSDSECPTGYSCKNNECIQTPGEGQAPGEGQIPGGECSSDNDCPPGQHCDGGTCSDVYCPCGSIDNHACTEYGCCSDDDCLQGYRCESNECIEEAPEPANEGEDGGVEREVSGEVEGAGPGETGEGEPEGVETWLWPLAVIILAVAIYLFWRRRK